MLLLAGASKSLKICTRGPGLGLPYGNISTMFFKGGYSVWVKLLSGLVPCKLHLFEVDCFLLLPSSSPESSILSRGLTV